MRTFAITGTGRCGTKSLAIALEMKSGRDWRIEHEPTNDRFELCSALQLRFLERSEKVNYGECNPWLRFAIIPLEVDAKYILLRDPLDVWKSIVRKHIGRIHGSAKKELAARRQIEKLNLGLLALDAAISYGIEFFRLEEIAEDPSPIADRLGIPIRAIPHLNQGERPEIPIPAALSDLAVDVFDWFRREYL